jgi:hypothetical protein
MTGSEDREATETEWLKRLQEAAGAKETLVEYTRRRGLRVGEAYRWKQHLRRTGQWPRDVAKQKTTKRATSEELRFAQVRVVPDHGAESMTPLRLDIQLVNGRRAALTLSDEAQLARVLKLLEQPL